MRNDIAGEIPFFFDQFGGDGHIDQRHQYRKGGLGISRSTQKEKGHQKMKNSKTKNSTSMDPFFIEETVAVHDLFNIMLYVTLEQDPITPVYSGT